MQSGGRRERAAGQVLIELIIVIPIFLMVVFMIMELGNLAFQTILVHHTAFELARIGSLSAAPRPGEGWSPNISRANSVMQQNFTHMFKKGATWSMRVEGTLDDPQSGLPDHDIVVDVAYKCPLVFPITSLILQSDSGGMHKSESKPFRTLYAEVRMPIQQPTYR